MENISPPSCLSLQESLLIERYKYVLDQKKTLNSNVFRFFAFFQTIGGLLSAGALSLLIQRKNDAIELKISLLSAQCLMVVLTLFSILILFLVISGVFSWFSYRKEEDLILQTLNLPFTPQASAKSFWRWHETWFAFFIVLTNMVIWAAYVKLSSLASSWLGGLP